MADVVVLGAGVMGSAFCVPLCDTGNNVRLVGTHLDEDIVSELKEGRAHPRLGIILPDRVTAFGVAELEQAFTEPADLVVLGVSSAGVDWAIEKLIGVLDRDVPILMLTKGLAVSADGSLEILPDKVRRELAASGLNTDVGAVGGPCIAGELAVRRHSAVTIGFRDQNVVDAVLGMTETPYYHPVGTRDLIGLEACAALKNFYALAVGSADGLLESSPPAENSALMNNPAALLFTRCLYEMAHLVEFMGGKHDSVYDRPGVGDFFVTCLAGRNSWMGRLLGLGLTYSDAKRQHMADDTIEGAELALEIGPSIVAAVADGRLQSEEIPVTLALVQSICDDTPFEIPWSQAGNA